MSNNKTKNVAKYSIIVSLILILSKIIGYIREFLVAAQLGQSAESDIFKTATRIPNLFYSCIAAGIATSFIPVFSSVKNDKEEANRLFNNIFNFIFVICSILALIGILFSNQLTDLFITNFSASDLNSISIYTKITMPAIIFLALNGLMTGYLQSYGVFIQSALTSIISSIIMIIGIILIPQYGLIAGILAFLIGSISQVLFQRPFMKEYKYRFLIDLKDENLKQMMILSLPVLVSSAVSQINVIVDSRFASSLAKGSISVIDNASKISTIINQVFIVSITTILFPMLTDKFSEGNKKEFEDLIIKSVNIVVIVTIPLLCGMIALSTPLVQLLLQHGKFNAHDTQITARCLKYLALGTLGYSLIDVLVRIFLAIKDTVTPMINGFVTVGLNILFIIVLVPRLGVIGLALATTTSASIIAIVMFFELKKKLKDINFNNFVIVILKAAISGAIMGVLVFFTYKLMNIVAAQNSIIFLTGKIALATIVGAVIYLGLLLLLRVEDVKNLLSLKKQA